MSVLAVVTVAHPAARPFIGEMAASLRAQTDRDFTVLIVDDGCGDAIRAFDGLSHRVLSPAGSIAGNRRAAVEAAIDGGFDSVVFSDADDTFTADRIARSRAALRANEVVMNELLVGDQPAFGPRLGRRGFVDLRTILDGNCLGLSNTAARVGALAGPIKTLDPQHDVVDWALFTRVLFDGRRAAFLDDVYTVYRRHDASIGTLAEQDERSVLRALNVKASHYRALRNVDATFAERADAFGSLWMRVHGDRGAADEYVRFCRLQAPAHPLWWEIARRMP